MSDLKLLLYDEENCESYEFPGYVQRAFSKVLKASVMLERLKSGYLDESVVFKDLSIDFICEDIMDDVLIRSLISLEKSISDYTYFINSKQ